MPRSAPVTGCGGRRPPRGRIVTSTAHEPGCRSASRQRRARERGSGASTGTKRGAPLARVATDPAPRSPGTPARLARSTIGARGRLLEGRSLVAAILSRLPPGRGRAGAQMLGPPSSSGLGFRPFKAATRVRIPLGAHNRILAAVEESGVLIALSRRRSRDRSPSAARDLAAHSRRPEASAGLHTLHHSRTRILIIR